MTPGRKKKDAAEGSGRVFRDRSQGWGSEEPKLGDELRIICRNKVRRPGMNFK